MKIKGPLCLLFKWAYQPQGLLSMTCRIESRSGKNTGEQMLTDLHLYWINFHVLLYIKCRYNAAIKSPNSGVLEILNKICAQDQYLEKLGKRGIFNRCIIFFLKANVTLKLLITGIGIELFPHIWIKPDFQQLCLPDIN